MPDRSWRDALFLLDGGADRTILDSRFLHLLETGPGPLREAPLLRGVGGDVGCRFFEFAIAFFRTDGSRVTVRGPFGVFTDPDSSDVPVLGRDVTNNFDVIYSYPRHEVVLLSRPHGYEVRS